jgi:histidinol-phosphate aminotransferase
MSPFPRPDYEPLKRYHFDRTPVALDVSDNTNQWGAHPAALEVARCADDNALARYPDLYADDLRAAAAAHLGVPEACIATGCGSDDILDCAYRACAGGPDDFVAAAVPTFPMGLQLARMNGMGARSVPWSDALADPQRLLEGGPALVYVCRPNNPTGHLAPAEWVDALLDAAGEGGPLVILDEAYIDFGGDSFAARAVGRTRTLVSRTLSKAFGLAGLRVGYAVGTPETILEVEKARGPYKVSRMACEAAAAALADAGGWVARTVADCVACRERAHAALSERGLDPLPSLANFILFRAPSGDARADALGIRSHGVAVRPFVGEYPGGTDALRVTIAPWPLMERFLDALDTFCGNPRRGPNHALSG